KNARGVIRIVYRIDAGAGQLLGGPDGGGILAETDQTIGQGSAIVAVELPIAGMEGIGFKRGLVVRLRLVQQLSGLRELLLVAQQVRQVNERAGQIIAVTRNGRMLSDQLLSKLYGGALGSCRFPTLPHAPQQVAQVGITISQILAVLGHGRVPRGQLLEEL